MLISKYASARSAGNYLAGYNGAIHRMYGFSISFDTYMGLTGALQSKNWNATDKGTAIGIVAFGTRYGPARYYGELPYTGRMVDHRFAYGVRKSYATGGSSEATYARSTLQKLGYTMDH